MISFTDSKSKDLKDVIPEKMIDTSKTEELWNRLRVVFDTIKWYFHSNIFPSYINGYKDKFLYTWDRYALLKKLKMTDKSNKKRPLVASVHDTYFSNTYDTKTTIKAIPVWDEDVKRAEIVQQYIERWFSVDATDEAIKQMDWEAILVWSWFWKVGFYDEKSTLSYVNKWKEKQQKINRQYPTVTYVDLFSLYFNPNATNFYTTPKFYRELMTITEAKSKYEWFFNFDKWEEQYLLNKPMYFDDKDYKQIKTLSRWNDTMSWSWGCIVWWVCIDDIVNKEDSTNSDFTNIDYSVDWKNNTIEVIEYWEDWKFVLFFNWYVVYDWPSPYPFEGDPFIQTQFKTIPWTLFPVWIAQLLTTIQKDIDNFLNSWIDTINWMVNTPYIADKWVFWPNTPRTMNLIPRKVYERVSWKWIEPLKLSDPAVINQLLSWIQFFNTQAYEKVWLNSYTQWWAGKVERTAWWVSSRTQILKTALVPFYANKDKMLQRLANKRLALWAVLLSDKTKIRLLWENYKVEFAEVKKSDLIWNFDFFFDNESLKSISKNEERQDLMQWLQYAKSPETAKLLEKKLLETFDISWFSLEDKKNQIDEDITLQKYTQDQMQKQWVWQQQWQSQQQAQGSQNAPWVWGLTQVPQQQPTDWVTFWRQVV